MTRASGEGRYIHHARAQDVPSKLLIAGVNPIPVQALLGLLELQLSEAEVLYVAFKGASPLERVSNWYGRWFGWRVVGVW